MKMHFRLNQALVLLLSLCILAGCESKEEKQARIEREAVVAENKKAAAENAEVDKLFANVKRTPVDLGEPVMTHLRASLPRQSIAFEGETPDMTAAGDGAVSACSTAIGEKARGEYCYGKVVIAQGAVDAAYSDGFVLKINGVALAIVTAPGSVALAPNDRVQVRGTAAEGVSQGYIGLSEPDIQKLAVAPHPLQARLDNALALARLCFATGTLTSTLSVAPGELPSNIGDIATDNDDPGGGTITVDAFGEKIDGEWVPHLRRCAVRNGKVVGDQVRAGKIVKLKAVFADASGQWESEKVVSARVQKANDAKWHADRAAYRKREKENALTEQRLWSTMKRIKAAPDSTERSVAIADCLIALDKAERAVASWDDARVYCLAKSMGVPGIQPK